MAMVKIGRMTAPECDCCGARGRLAPTEFVAGRWAHIGKWDTPGQLEDGTPYEGYLRCPWCVDHNCWPLECDGWFVLGPDPYGDPAYCGTGDGPTIRLADGDLAVTGPLDALPDALVETTNG